MLVEIALEPDLVATWTDRQIGRFFVEKFGLGQPRIVSRYPKAWKRLVWEAFGAQGTDLERKRLEELLARLCEVMVRRGGGPWDPGESWLTNAKREHARIPFSSILARSTEAGHPYVLAADDLTEASPGWTAPRGVTVARSAPDLAAAIGGLLRAAETIVLIDPHFKPEARYLRSLQAFLQESVRRRPLGLPQRIEVLSSDTPSNGTEEYFGRECRRRLPPLLPAGIHLRVCRLRSPPAGELLHNRYILTEHGGVAFGVGLDAGAADDTDDLHLLERPQYELRWGQYAGNPAAFTPAGPDIEL